MGFYKKEELLSLGVGSVGENVLISDKVSIYGASRLHIGNNVRIDDFCIISAGEKGIYLGNNIHIACYVSLIGQEKITVEDFAGISSKVAVYSSTDDYSGKYLTNPMIPDEFKNVISKPVHFGKHVIIGANSVILPGVKLGLGVAVGALSLVNKSYDDFLIIGGSPAKVLKVRDRNLITLEKKYTESLRDNT